MRPSFLIAFVTAVAVLPAFAFEISGIVCDAGGNPVSAASVWLSQERRVHVTQTDARGRFGFQNARAVRTELVAWKAGYALGGLEGPLLDSADVRLVLPEPEVLRLRLLDEQSRPIEGASVKVMFVNEAFHVSVEDLVEHGFPSWRSDAEGRLEVPAAPKDGYVALTVSHRGYVEESLPPLPANTELTIRLMRGVVVRGRVIDAGSRGVPRARVSLFRAGREFVEVVTDPEGFYVARVPPGEYYAAVNHPDFAIPRPVPVQWKPGEDIAILDLTLPPGHRVFGRVLGPGETPVPGARIQYVTGGAVYAEAVTDAQGRYELIAPEGDGLLRIDPPEGFMPAEHRDRLIAIAAGNPEFEMEAVRLQPLPVIEGVITLRDDAPLDKVLVTVLNVEPAIRVITDAEGRFRIRLDRFPREDQLRVRAEHAFRLLRRDFTMPVGGGRPREERLRSFDPDLTPAPKTYPNDLSYMVGRPAPEWACDAWFNVPEGREGGPTVAGWRGKVIVLTLWGGWDAVGPGGLRIRDRIDELRALHVLFRDEPDVAFVAVHDASVGPEEVARYVREYQIEFPVGHDADPFLTFDRYNTNQIPQTVLIDKRGIVRHYAVEGRLLELIKDLRRRG